MPAPLIDRPALRIMRRFPQLFGPKHEDRATRAWGFECGPGWLGIIEALCEDLAQSVQEDGLAGFHILRVKEKHGSLRMHVAGGNDRAWDRIDIAEDISAITCEACGASPHPIRSHKGWLSTCCDPCLRELRRKRTNASLIVAGP